MKHELVFAASTTSDRAAWANAIKDAISRAKTGAPTSGWLHKEGGRKSGMSFVGWKRRWFVLPPPRKADAVELKYFDTPAATTSKGVIKLRGSDVFVPKEVKGIKREYQHNFCIASEGIEKGKPVTLCTLLAASTAEERDIWVASLTESITSINNAKVAAAPTSCDATRGAKVAGDAGAASVQAGNALNLEQMKMLEPDVLLTLRIKQLKAILDHMGQEFVDALEKSDLVAKIVKNRAV